MHDTSTSSFAKDPTSDKPDRYARKALVASAAGYGVDGMDNLTVGFALSALAADLHLSQSAAGSLATLTLVGAVFGGIGFGILGDRLGRVKVLTWTIILFAVFTGLSSLAQGYWDLATYRFIAGLGLGGEFGLGMALVAEAWPASSRARATSLVGVGGQVGVLIGTLLAGPIVQNWGWRALFALGILPAALAFVLRATLKEPPSFVRVTGDRQSFLRPLTSLFSDRRTVRTTLALMVLTSVQTFGYYGIMTWLPTYLADTFGFSLSKSSLWTAATIIGMAAGMYVFGRLADRLGRRPAFWTFQVCAIFSVIGYSQVSDPTVLLIAGIVMGVFVNGMLGGYGALMAELYPMHARATAENVIFNVGRAVGGFAPIVFAFVARSHGFGLAIALLAALYALDIIVMFAIPDRKGQPLDESGQSGPAKDDTGTERTDASYS